MPERPQRIGLPSIFSDYWDPIIKGPPPCADTDTVISLHVGSTGGYGAPEDAPRGTGFGMSGAMFGFVVAFGLRGMAFLGLSGEVPEPEGRPV